MTAMSGLSIAQIKLQTEEAKDCCATDMAAQAESTEDDVALAQCLLRGLHIEDERFVPSTPRHARRRR